MQAADLKCNATRVFRACQSARCDNQCCSRRSPEPATETTADECRQSAQPVGSSSGDRVFDAGVNGGELGHD